MHFEQLLALRRTFDDDAAPAVDLYVLAHDQSRSKLAVRRNFQQQKRFTRTVRAAAVAGPDGSVHCCAAAQTRIPIGGSELLRKFRNVVFWASVLHSEDV